MVSAAGRRVFRALASIVMVMLLALHGYATPRLADAASDVVAQAKAAVVEYAGPQTTWKGPTSAPKPATGMKIVFLSGDEQNDISHEYGVYIQQAAAKIGWTATVIDGKGSPTSWLAGMDQAIALKPNGIVMFADAKSLQPAIARGLAQGVKFVGIHAAGLPGPQPDLHLFVNIEEDPRAIGRAEADWAIADSNGKARVVLVSHNEYAIASVKSHASEDEVKKCSTCKVLEYVSFPASEASQHMPQLTTGWVQRFGLPFYGISVGDNDWDYAIPTLRQGNVSPDQVKLIGAGLRTHSRRRPVSVRYGVGAVRAAGLAGSRRAQSRLSRRAAKWFRSSAVPRHSEKCTQRRRRQRPVCSEQRLQGALPQDLGRVIGNTSN